MAAMSRGGRDPNALHRKQAPILASNAKIDGGVAEKTTAGVPRAIAAEATIVGDRGRREGWDLTAALMPRCELSHPEGLILEASHLSLHSFMSQRRRSRGRAVRRFGALLPVRGYLRHSRSGGQVPRGS